MERAAQLQDPNRKQGPDVWTTETENPEIFAPRPLCDFALKWVAASLRQVPSGEMRALFHAKI
jgi:hypothetical protein